MVTRKRFTINDDSAGIRLDRFLNESLPDQSRSYLQKLIARGLISVNGGSAKKKRMLLTGDVVEVDVPEETVAALRPEDSDLEILFEDDSLLVVNKPADMVVHPGAGNREGTLVNKLLGLNYEQFMAMMDADERPGIVHRLDKDTSGVMVIAKTMAAKHRLAKQFEEREVKKRYLAIVKGHLPQRENLRVETRIARHPVHRKRMTVCESGGRSAVSIFRTVDETDDVSLVQANILTGRTHQIRVHLAHLACPILGDAVYGKAGGMAPRQMLHAWKLTINHPKTNQPMSFVAPPPEDFLEVLSRVGLQLS